MGGGRLKRRRGAMLGVREVLVESQRNAAPGSQASRASQVRSPSPPRAPRLSNRCTGDSLPQSLGLGDSIHPGQFEVCSIPAADEGYGQLDNWCNCRPNRHVLCGWPMTTVLGPEAASTHRSFAFVLFATYYIVYCSSKLSCAKQLKLLPTTRRQSAARA